MVHVHIRGNVAVLQTGEDFCVIKISILVENTLVRMEELATTQDLTSINVNALQVIQGKTVKMRLMCVFHILVNTMGRVHPAVAHSSVLVHLAGRAGFVRKTKMIVKVSLVSMEVLVWTA